MIVMPHGLFNAPRVEYPPLGRLSLVTGEVTRETRRNGARHFIRRVQDRYLVSLTVYDMLILESLIARNDPNRVKYLQAGACGRRIYAILVYPGFSAKVVYDPQEQRIITALPPPWHEDYKPPTFYLGHTRRSRDRGKNPLPKTNQP